MNVGFSVHQIHLKAVAMCGASILQRDSWVVAGVACIRLEDIHRVERENSTDSLWVFSDSSFIIVIFFAADVVIAVASTFAFAAAATALVCSYYCCCYSFLPI